ncbi:EFR1 family ferrodoxin [Chloroflexota bacterium]
MKCIIIYFSLTGNTKMVTKAIQRGMNGLVDCCDLVKLKDVDVQKLHDYDLIGLGSPVWSGPPVNVRIFLRNLPIIEGKHAFTFTTHGATPERFFPMVCKTLTEKGLTVIGINDWYGSGNMPISPKPYLTDGHPDETDIREAEEWGKEIAERSRRIYAGETDLIPDLQDLPWERPGAGPPRERPTLNTEKCLYPECRLCMDNCPMGSIDLSFSPPIFAVGNCRPCYFCEMICPTGAIEVDYGPPSDYECRRAREDFAKNIEEAEAAGKFRRLVPIEEVGFDTPYHTFLTKHPRWVIPEDD